MSSATKRARRAGVGGVSALIAVTSFLATAGTAHALPTPGATGQIGIVDKGTAKDGINTGATLVTATPGQMLGDVRLLIPNTFKAGDKIDLNLTGTGGDNSDAAHKLAFVGTPNVSVDAKAYDASLNITANTDSTKAADPSVAGENTEHGDRVVAADNGTANGPTAPVISVSRQVSARSAKGAGYTDQVELKFNKDATGSNPADKFVLTVSGLAADLGSQVAPGELKIVPVASDYNFQTDAYTPSTTFFAGNTDSASGLTINDQYTVPAFVKPVSFNVATPNNVFADGTAQQIGDITIAEVNNQGLAGGTYTIGFDGAAVSNTSDSPITVKITNPGMKETVDATATVAGDQKSISFKLDQSNSGVQWTKQESTITVSGVLLSSSTQGPITYTLHNSTIDGEMAADSSANQSDITPDTSFLSQGALATAFSTRLGGADRYQTAAKVALSKTSSSDTIVLASGENFPDALSSAYLASAKNGVTLLTHKDSLPDVTLDAFRQLFQRNDSQLTVYVVGGTGAVSDQVVNDLRSNVTYPMNVIRLAGADRYATNKKVNEYVAGANGVGRTQPAYGKASMATAMIASGQDYPDALAAAPATAGAPEMGAIPLILTQTNKLSSDAAAQLEGLSIQRAIIVGGESAVSAATKSAIESVTGNTAERLAGQNRYETATKIADWEVSPAVPTATTAGGGLAFDRNANNDQVAYLATGGGFADALAAGALAGSLGDPLLLTSTDSLSDATSSWLTSHAGDYKAVIGLGLAGAVSNSALNEANNIVIAK